VNLGFGVSVFTELLLLVVIVEFSLHVVKVVILPVSISSLCLLNLNISLDLVVVVLQVAVGDNIIVTDTNFHNVLAPLLLWGIWRWTFVRSSKVMFSHRLVTEDVPVNLRVLPGSKVPGLILRVIISIFKTF
jgi:hypothetical protein